MFAERGSVRCLMKPPETFIHSIDGDLRASLATRFVSDERLENDDGAGGVDDSRRSFLSAELIGQYFSEKQRRSDDEIRCTKSIQKKTLETGSNRVADQKCPGQNGDRHGHAQDHGEVRSPVVGETSDD